MAAKEKLQFGPLERVLDIRFPKPLKVYWVWATGGAKFQQKFPGNERWVDQFSDKTTGIPFHLSQAAPWLNNQNIFNGSRNPIKAHSLATFCGITRTEGKYQSPTSIPFRQELWHGTTINETGSDIIGGFFLVKDEAVLYATNLFNKGHFFLDFASKHSWPYQYGAVAVPVPVIFRLIDLDGAPVQDPINFICDNIAPGGTGTIDGTAAYYAYLSTPKAAFNTLEIWETNWPTQGGTGPINAAFPPVKLHVGRVSKTDPLSPLANLSGDPGTFHYAIFEGGGTGAGGFQTYKNDADHGLGLTGTQISDYFETLAEAITSRDTLSALANEKSRLFFPVDRFPRDFDYSPKLVKSIRYSNGGRSESSAKPPVERHVCTVPPSLSPVGGFAVVFDSCGNKVATNLGLGSGIGGIVGTVNLGLDGPFGFDYTGLTKP